MATKRPPSSRSKLPPNVPAPRPKSAMSKSISSSPPDVETNIQVVIRCRRRSDREIQENSPIIVNSQGAKSNQIHIETTAPSSTLGIVSLPPVRTYPFDLVFGPEADQAMIYHEVVGPMLEQVILGYNCTLFAYGQTGTGKTYTMQGDLTRTPMGNPSAQAGMIPRALFRLFHHLETSESDFSVKVSYVELYNEELRDLLANDLPPPTGSTQPMGKDANKHDNGLKIFDEPNKRGVFIQGLEEIPVKDSKDALALLAKGSERRQIAATKFNDHSSRSHSIFSITVHIKEQGVAGDDLLKIGKLNLVDLAGSENIGRSGAENKRAREAGMINQSLLTLGRVINALVEKAQHVPYRESKLTRLLQDSLGGRTKTCIIATVSPARCNLEETLSTLDYALGAKSIRNKPEVNQRMTRNALLKEYIGEIERLKADLLAAREKNGIFFSEETWNQLTAEQELRQTEMEEAKKQVEIIESQMRAVREEFEQSIGLLMKRDAELKETQEQLSHKEALLTGAQTELTAVQGALDEEICVRQAFEQNERVIDGVASGLKAVAAEGVHNVDGLFQKLDRKEAVLTSNLQAVSSNGKILSSATVGLTKTLEDFLTASSRSITRLQKDATQYQSKELATLSSLSGRIEQQLQRLQTNLQLVRTHDAAEADAVTAIQAIIKQTQDTFKKELASWNDTLTGSCTQTLNEFHSASSTAFSNAEKSIKSISVLLENTIREATEFVQTEQQSLRHIQGLAIDASNAEIQRLKEQNDILVRLLEVERARSDKAKDDLILRVSSLLADYTKERDQELRKAFTIVHSTQTKAQDEMKTFHQQFTQATDSMDARSSATLAMLSGRSGDCKRTRDGCLKNLTTAKSSNETHLHNLETLVSDSVISYSSGLHKQMHGVYTSSSEELERLGRAKRARLESTQGMTNDLQSELTGLHQTLGGISKKSATFMGTVESEGSNLHSSIEGYGTSTRSHAIAIRQATQSLLKEATAEDLPTGGTPRRRAWNYVDHWELTGSRESILRRRGATSPTQPQSYTRERIETIEEASSPSVESQHPSSAASPVATSLASSLASSVEIVVAPSKKPMKANPPSTKAIPVLVDTRNIYTTRGSRRQRGHAE